MSLLSLYSTPLNLSLPFFILKSALSDVSMATPAFFYLSFAWSVIFHPFTQAHVCLWILDVSWKQYIVVSFFFLVHPAILWLLIVELSPFIFKGTIDVHGLNTAIFSLVFWLFYISTASLPRFFWHPFQYSSFLWWFFLVFSLFINCNSVLILF